MHLVILVSPLLLVVVADGFAVGSVLYSLLVVCLEVLVPAPQDAPAVLLVIFEGSLIHFLLVVAICYFSAPVLHVVLELPVINRIAHLQHPSSALLPVVVIALVEIPIGPGQSASPMELVVLYASFVVGTCGQLDSAVLVLSLVINVFAFIYVSIAKDVFSLAVFLAIVEVALVVIS